MKAKSRRLAIRNLVRNIRDVVVEGEEDQSRSIKLNWQPKERWGKKISKKSISQIRLLIVIYIYTYRVSENKWMAGRSPLCLKFC